MATGCSDSPVLNRGQSTTTTRVDVYACQCHNVKPTPIYQINKIDRGNECSCHHEGIKPRTLSTWSSGTTIQTTQLTELVNAAKSELTYRSKQTDANSITARPSLDTVTIDDVNQMISKIEKLRSAVSTMPVKKAVLYTDLTKMRNALNSLQSECVGYAACTCNYCYCHMDCSCNCNRCTNDATCSCDSNVCSQVGANGRVTCAQVCSCNTVCTCYTYCACNCNYCDCNYGSQGCSVNTRVPNCPSHSGVCYGTHRAVLLASYNYRVYASAGAISFTVPANVTVLRVTLIGGGGGGAASSYSNASAGSGGTTSFASYTATGGGGGSVAAYDYGESGYEYYTYAGGGGSPSGRSGGTGRGYWSSAASCSGGAGFSLKNGGTYGTGGGGSGYICAGGGSGGYRQFTMSCSAGAVYSGYVGGGGAGSGGSSGTVGAIQVEYGVGVF